MRSPDVPQRPAGSAGLRSLLPVRMVRVALVAPAESLRAMLVRVADAGVVEIDQPPADRAGRDAEPARPGGPVRPMLCVEPPDLTELRRSGRAELIAGEAEIRDRMAGAVTRGSVAAVAGWMPDEQRPGLAARLAAVGAAVVPLPHPRGAEPPTMLAGGALRRTLAPLVSTYGTVPYRDIDPTPLAWAAYVFMFGMMFGDVGHGALVLAGAAALRAGWPRPLRRFGRAWPFVAGAGVTSTMFGFLYGEFFGPTDVVPVLWLQPLEQPVELLGAAVAVGAVLLVGAYAIGTLNRRREGGWRVALYDPTGVAGAAAFVGLVGAAGGLGLGWPVLTVAGCALAAIGLALALIGFLAAAGRGVTAVVEAAVELFDLVIRLGANLVSFARLAAFGMTHAALGAVVWSGAAALWGGGGGPSSPWDAGAAVVLFVVGNALAFSLEALVAGVQALRLEYYELFSRVFSSQGRAFRPWHVPILVEGPGRDGPAKKGEEPCPQH